MNKQNKKVLLVITKSNFGGAQKYVFELAKSLKSKDFDVQVVVGGSGILIQKLRDENISTLQIPFLGRDISFKNDVRTFFALLKIIRNFNPDVVHLNSSKIGGIGALVSRLCFVPKTIFTIHGWAFNEDRTFISKLVIKFLYFITILLSNTSIAVSVATKKQAKSIPFSFLIMKKIAIVQNGIYSPYFLSKQDSKDFLLKKVNSNIENPIIIGQIAELHPIKSIETTIDAAKSIIQTHKNVIFISIGEGQEREFLQKKITENGLQDNFFLVGFIDNAAQYIPAFDILCLTSKSEALALVLIEAGLAKVPIISSNVGGIPELITDSETGFLFQPGNAQVLKEKMEMVLQLEDQEKDKVTEAFYTKINNNFLIQHMTEKTITYY